MVSEQRTTISIPVPPVPVLQETKTTRPPTTITTTKKHKRSNFNMIRAPGNMEHKYQKIHGEKMSVLTIEGQEYLIGVEIASLLQRETYNLYRSMKGVKKITVMKASSEQVDYLLKTNVVKLGTRSITFIPLDQGTSYIKEELGKAGLRKKPKDKSYDHERKKTPPPMMVSVEPEVATEARPNKQKVSEEHENNPLEILVAAAEDEYTQANSLKKSSTPSRPIITTSPPLVIPLPFSLEPASAAATTPTPTTTTPSTKLKLDNFFPFLLPSLFGLGAHDNAIYKPYGENIPKAIENQHVASVLGR